MESGVHSIIRFDFELDCNSIMITGHPAAVPSPSPSSLPGLHHGPVAAVASLAKNGNVYMRVAQCHNVACIGYVPPPPLSPSLSLWMCQCPCMCWQHFLRVVNYMARLACRRGGEERGGCQSDSRLVCAVSEGHVHALSPGGLCLVIASW